MKRWVWLGIAIVLLVGISFGWSEIRRRELVRLIDEPPAVHVEADSWRLFYDRFMESDYFARLRESEAVLEILESPGGRDFMDLRGGLEVVLDEDPAQLFLRTFGRRLDGGIWLRKTGGFALGIVSLPEEGTDLDDVAARINVMAKSSPQEPSREVEGMTVFPLGNEGVMVFGNGVAVLSSHQTLGLALAQRGPDPIRSRDDIEPGIHVRLGPEVYGGDFVDTRFDDALRTLGSLVLFGGATRVLDEAENLRLDLIPVDGGVRAQARFDVGLEALGPQAAAYAPNLSGESPLVADEILRFELSRDLARFWAERDSYLSEGALRRLAADEAEADLTGLTQAVFEGVEPTLMVRMLNVPAATDAGSAPALGLVARLSEPELAPRLERALELGLAAANEDFGGRARFDLEPGRDDEGMRLRRIAIESSELDASGEQWRDWVEPVFARSGSQVILATHPALARAVIGEPVAETREAARPASDRIRVRAEPLHRALEANFDLLVQSQMQDRSVGRERSERELRGVLTLLEGLSELELEWSHAEQETVVSLELQGR